MATFLGGPHDGKEAPIRPKDCVLPRKIVVPGPSTWEAVWYEKDEPVPAEIDLLTGELRPKQPPLRCYMYELTSDGNYIYRGRVD